MIAPLLNVGLESEVSLISRQAEKYKLCCKGTRIVGFSHFQKKRLNTKVSRY